MEFVYIGIGGALGSMSRFVVSRFVSRRVTGRIPLGTLLVNTLGSFLLAVLVFSGITGSHISEEFKLLFTTGFLGSFTTFSTFVYEDLTMLRDGEVFNSILYLLVGIVTGLAGAAAGYCFAMRVIGG
jgi:CrcB protein